MKGIVFFETEEEITCRCLAVEQNEGDSIIIRCKGSSKGWNRKRGVWAFRVHRFLAAESIEYINKSLSTIFPDFEGIAQEIKEEDLRRILDENKTRNKQTRP